MASEFSQMVNDEVCRMGWGSFDKYGQGKTCGQIKILSERRESCVDVGLPTEECIDVRKTNVVDFDSTGGDSGGPVYAPKVDSASKIMFGIHVHSEVDDSNNDDEGWFSPMFEVRETLIAVRNETINLCNSSNC